jgi:hypothetical protein
MSIKDKEYVTYYLVGCPECNKDLDYTIDVKIDQLYAIQGNQDSKMKQSAKALIAEHNTAQKHNARLFEYKCIEDSDIEAYYKEILRKEKIAILKDILCLAK